MKTIPSSDWSRQPNRRGFQVTVNEIYSGHVPTKYLVVRHRSKRNEAEEDFWSETVCSPGSPTSWSHQFSGRIDGVGYLFRRGSNIRTFTPSSPPFYFVDSLSILPPKRPHGGRVTQGAVPSAFDLLGEVDLFSLSGRPTVYTETQNFDENRPWHSFNLKISRRNSPGEEFGPDSIPDWLMLGPEESCDYILETFA